MTPKFGPVSKSDDCFCKMRPDTGGAVRSWQWTGCEAASIRTAWLFYLVIENFPAEESKARAGRREPWS